MFTIYPALFMSALCFLLFRIRMDYAFGDTVRERVTVQTTGQSLEDLARHYYCHEGFSGVLGEINRVTNTQKPIKKASVVLPSPEELVARMHLPADVDVQALVDLFSAWQKLCTMELQLTSSRPLTPLEAQSHASAYGSPMLAWVIPKGVVAVAKVTQIAAERVEGDLCSTLKRGESRPKRACESLGRFLIFQKNLKDSICDGDCNRKMVNTGFKYIFTDGLALWAASLPKS